MSENKNGNKENNTEIKDLIMRASMDEDFKKLLMEKPEDAMSEYELTEVQKMLLKTLRPEDWEKLDQNNLEELFSADSAVYTPDMEAEMETDVAEEDDI